MALTLSTVFIIHGLLDGSAGVALTGDAFLGASDEVNGLYRISVSVGAEPVVVGSPLLNLSKGFPRFPVVVDADNDDPTRPDNDVRRYREADLESAAQLGNTTYWVGSHASSRKPGKAAKPRPERQVLFATRMTKATDGSPLPVPTGQVYTHLLTDLTTAPALTNYGLAAASALGPKDGPSVENPAAPYGFNIESLCAAADGHCLFIGLRNPLIPDPAGGPPRALLIPLLNAPELIATDSTASARFDPAIELDLQGRGLRDMVWWRGHYLLIGGAFGEHLTNPKALKPKLFRWSGKLTEAPRMLDLILDDLNPEGLVVFPADATHPEDRLLILSDDGALLDANGKSAKESGAPPTFRAVLLEGSET